MVLAVLLVPEPATTGTRPAAVSMTILTTRSCSSSLRVTDSPVVPQGTRPLVPLRTWYSTSPRSFSSSTAPSLNGVISATSEPENFTPDMLTALLSSHQSSAVSHQRQRGTRCNHRWTQMNTDG